MIWTVISPTAAFLYVIGWMALAALCTLVVRPADAVEG